MLVSVFADNHSIYSYAYDLFLEETLDTVSLEPPRPVQRNFSYKYLEVYSFSKNIILLLMSDTGQDTKPDN